jgi:hypothetical protein
MNAVRTTIARHTPKRDWAQQAAGMCTRLSDLNWKPSTLQQPCRTEAGNPGADDKDRCLGRLSHRPLV